MGPVSQGENEKPGRGTGRVVFHAATPGRKRATSNITDEKSQIAPCSCCIADAEYDGGDGFWSFFFFW
jgi:hypothetical protein